MWCSSFIDALRIVEEKWRADKKKCQLIGGKVKKALKVEFVFPVFKRKRQVKKLHMNPPGESQ